MNKKPCTLQDYLLLQSVKICLIWIIFMPFALLAFSGRVAGTNKNKRDRRKKISIKSVKRELWDKSSLSALDSFWDENQWVTGNLCSEDDKANVFATGQRSSTYPALMFPLCWMSPIFYKLWLIPFTDFFPSFVSFSYNSVLRSHIFFLLCVILKVTSVTCIITFTSASDILPYCTTLLKYIRFWHTFS